MISQYFFVIFSAVIIFSTICSVESVPVSQTSSTDISTVTNNNKPLASSISRSTTKKPKRSSKFKTVRDSEGEGENENEAEVIEGDGGNADADSPNPNPPGKNGLPYFPSFNKPFEEFQADLDKIFEHINAGLEKVVEGFHELVHDPGVSHDKMFITAFDPDLFKDMLAKDDARQAEKRRLLEERKAKAQLKASRVESLSTTVKPSIS